MLFATKQDAPTPEIVQPPAAPVIAPRRADLVMVRFSRWTAFGDTAYQAGQCAGFTRRDADILVKKGAAREIL